MIGTSINGPLQPQFSNENSIQLKRYNSEVRFLNLNHIKLESWLEPKYFQKSSKVVILKIWGDSQKKRINHKWNVLEWKRSIYRG